MTALRTLFSLGEHIYDLEVVHNVHFLDITSLFDKQNAHWVKKNTVIDSIQRRVSAFLCHPQGKHKPSYVASEDGTIIPKHVGVEFLRLSIFTHCAFCLSNKDVTFMIFSVQI